jgi:hypothetical protein
LPIEWIDRFSPEKINLMTEIDGSFRAFPCPGVFAFLLRSDFSEIELFNGKLGFSPRTGLLSNKLSLL